MGSSAPAVKAALYARCQALFGDCQVVYGHPGPGQEPDIVSVGNVRSSQAVAALNALTRPREETLEVDVLISVWRGGGPEAQQPATQRAYALAALLEQALQTSDPNLSGTCRVARVTGHEMEEAWDLGVLETGRVTEIRLTITAHARI